jgi:uncharacterized protein YgiM (DUF1202 family)
MSDFDKRPPGDDDLPDWLNEPADSPRDEDSLGLTGELDWQSLDMASTGEPDLDAEFYDEPENPSEGEAVDWMATLRQSPTGPLGQPSGLTGQLDWQQGAFPEPESLLPDADDLPDWLNESGPSSDSPLPGAAPGVTRALWMDELDPGLPADLADPTVPPLPPRQTGTIKRITGELPPIDLPRQTGTIKRITGELPPVELPRQTGTIKRITGELPPIDPPRQTGTIKRITGQLPPVGPDEVGEMVEHDPPMSWLENFRAPDTDSLQPGWINDDDTLVADDLLAGVPPEPDDWAALQQPASSADESGGEAFWLRDDLDDGSPLLSNEEMGLEAPVPLRRADQYIEDDDEEMPGLGAMFTAPPVSNAAPMSAEDLDFLAGPLPIVDNGNLDMPDLDALLGEQPGDSLFSEEAAYLADNAEAPPDLDAILNAAGFDDDQDFPSFAEESLPVQEEEQLPVWDAALDDLFGDADQTPPPDFNALLADSAPDLGTIRLDDRPAAPLDIDALFDRDAAEEQRQETIRRTTSEMRLPQGALDSLFAQEPESDFDLTPPVGSEPEPARPTAAEIDARMEWFSESDEPASPAAVPDWLQRLDTSSLDITPAVELFPPEPEPEAPLPTTGRINDLKKPPPQVFSEPDPTDLGGLEDVDRLLAGYSFDERSLPQTANLENALRGDFDLLDADIEVEKAISAREQSRDAQLKAVTGMLSSDAPDWLKEAADTAAGPVEQVSAAAIIRKQAQREVPLNELSDRLQALSQKGRALPTAQVDAPGDALSKVLPGLNEVLPAVAIPVGVAVSRPDSPISKEQARNIQLLESLAGASAAAPVTAPRPAAIDLTLDAPTTFDDILAEPAAPAAEPATGAAQKRDRKRGFSRFRPKVDRLLIALLLLLAVGLPIALPALRIGSLPPAQFITGSPAERAWASVETVLGGDLVLIAAEYGPTGAAELDPALTALTEHILARGGRPVLVSSNPVGLLHAEQVIEHVATDPAFILLTNRSNTPYAYGEDYFVARYLPGEVIGLRSFAAEPGALLITDSKGQATGLALNSLQDFRLVVLVAERAEDVRAWAEQVAPLAAGPLVVAVGQGAAVLAEPYVAPGSLDPQPGISGLLVGMRDAYTYGQQVQTRLSNPLELIETRPPTQPPTLESGGESPAVTATPTPEVEVTATPAALIGEIDADAAVNVRAEPTTTAAILIRLNPDTEVAVLGRSANGDWVQVQLADGQTGWISADFVRIRPNETGSLPGGQQVVSLLSDSSFAQAATATPSPARTEFPSMTGEQIESMVATLGPAAYLTLTAIDLPPSPTPEATSTVTPASGTESNVAGAGTHSEAPLVRTGFNTAQETHWYSMTLGLVMIVAILLVGLLINLVGGLFKRERQRE